MRVISDLVVSALSGETQAPGPAPMTILSRVEQLQKERQRESQLPEPSSKELPSEMGDLGSGPCSKPEREGI